MSGHQTKGDKPDCRDSQPLQLAHQAQLDKRQLKTTLRASISKLEQQIQETETQLQEVTSKLRSPEKASQTVRDHIHLLHAYNEIRDIGQGLLGLIADARGARHIDIQNEFGVTTED